jgi:hypothetical protein
MRMPIILVLMLTVAPVRAAPLQNPFPAAAVAGPAELDGARGGFTTAAGVAVSLGIERIVTVDGQVVARSELRLGDLGRLMAGQAAPVTDNLTTVVQNSLNGRAIGTATIIHASVGAQGLLQTMHFQSTLANAINTAAAGK